MKFFTCCHCGLEKSQIYFYKDKYKPSGHKPRCKSCDLLSINKVLRKKYMEKYRAENISSFRAASVASHSRYKDKYLMVQKKYRQTEEYKHSHRKHCADARARSLGAFIESVNPYKLFESSSKKCAYCNQHLDETSFQIDHIVPLSKGGKHELSNINLCCRKCNIAKSNKLNWEVSHQIL